MYTAGHLKRRTQNRPLWLTLAFVAAIGLIVYWPLLVRDPFTGRDDLPDVAAFEQVHGLSEYFQARASGRIYDLLPVRDLTFLVDAAIKRTIGFSPYHVTNFALLLLCVAVALKIAGKISRRAGLAGVLIALAALHPVTTSSVAWISARKHLLACLFILLSTHGLVSLRGRGRVTPARALEVVASFVLSLVSQPILALWPIWALFYARVHRKELPARGWVVPAVCLVPMLIALYVNYRYYTGPYLALTGHAKYDVRVLADPTVELMAFGRYVTNLLFPTRIATVYYVGSSLNLAGVVLFPLLAYGLVAGLGLAQALLWLGLIFLGPLFMCFNKTNIFVSDTYAFSSVFFLALAFLPVLERGFSRAGGSFKAPAAVTAGVVAIFYFAGSAAVARSYTSTQALFERAFRLEPSPESLVHHINLTLLPEKRYSEAVAEAVRLSAWDPTNAYGPLLLSRSVFLDDSQPLAKRIQFLEGQPRQDHWSRYFTARLYSRAGNFQKAYELEASSLRSQGDFLGDRPTIEKQALEDCRKAGRTDCALIVQ